MLKTETNFILFLVLIIVFLGLLPLFTDLFIHTPPGTVYSFAHNYMLDYYQYLSWMKDGAAGKFLITSRYSAENFSRHPVYLFYPLLGFVCSKLGVSLPLGYTFARIFFSLIKLYALYFLISQALKTSLERKLAFFLALFLPPFYQIFPLKLLFPYISSLDPLMRTFFLPHNLATTIFLLLGSIYFDRSWVFSSGFFVLASLLNPAMTGLFYLFFFAGVFLTLLRQPEKILELAVGCFLLGLLTFPILFYYQRLFGTTLPFSWMFHQQKTVHLLGAKDYFLASGPLAFLAIFAIGGFFQRKDFLSKLVVTWAILPFFLAPFLGKTIPVSQERIFEISHFIPLSILAGYSLARLAKKIDLKIIFVCLGLFSLPYFFLSLKWQINMFSSPYFNIFIPRSALEAFDWLDKNTPDESVVATSYYTGNMLPAFSHNKVLFGHDFVTYQAQERLKELNFIYEQKSPPEKIKEILHERQVKYLLFTPESPPIETTNLAKINLKLIFSNDENQIYQVGP